MGPETAELAFLSGDLPAWLARRRVVLGAGEELAYDAAAWAGALVVVERGTVELAGRHGGRVRLRAGAVLWLTGLQLRAIVNPCGEPAVLVAVARRGPAAGRAA